MRESDWARVDYYGRKILQLQLCSCIKPTGGVHASADVLRDICAYRPVHVLLPHLRAISVELGCIPWHSLAPFFQALIGPELRSISITPDEDDDQSAGTSDLPRIFSCVSRLSPNVQTVRLVTKFMRSLSGAAATALSDLICALNDLRQVSYPCHLSEQAIRHLGDLPNLKKIGCLAIPPHHFPFYTTSNNRFPALTAFDFMIFDWSSAGELIHAMRCHFSSLTISTDPREAVLASSADLDRLMQSMRFHPLCTSLSAFSLSGPGISIDNQTSISYILRPLFDCPALKQLSLGFHGVNALTDEWLADAAASWPRLRILATWVDRGEPHMTLAGLIPLIKYCPDLYCIRLSIFAKPVDPSLHAGIFNNHTHLLYLRAPRIVTPAEVCRSLVLMFPRLEGVFVDGERPEDTSHWEWINTYLERKGNGIRNRRLPNMAHMPSCCI